MAELDVKIVEYEPALAGALADMWNRSGDSWGGYSIAFTEESVRATEAASVYENFYLAMIGDEVVGCSKIGRWTEGEGALYVEVLNVRPDLHGKKIGKALMLRSVERTIELDWPRLDLHTWAGNTKAVPLYKKTGFFWEERDREVYLVNFIPFVLKTELVADFFKKADWYTDSTRELLIEPDGTKENDFTYFTYSWEKDGSVVEMDFARRGRGLRRVKTDDFTITATVERPKTVFGREYEVVFEIENRTGAPAEAMVHGSDDGPVKFSLDEKRTVSENESIRGTFYVDRIEKKQSEWKTHPRVTAEVTFNGKRGKFEIGIEPQFPVELKLERSPGVLPAKGCPDVFLNVESHLDEEAEVTVALPVFDGLHFGSNEIKVTAPAKGRVSTPIAVSEASPGVYSGMAEVTTVYGSERTQFRFEVDIEMASLSGVYHGDIRMDESAKEYRVAAGAYSLGLAYERDAYRNVTHIRDAAAYGRVAEYGIPKLGEPFSEEFINRPPDDIVCKPAGEEAILEARFDSTAIPGVSILMHCRVTAAGRFDRWFTLTADDRYDTSRKLKLLDDFYLFQRRPVIPYDGTIVEGGTGFDIGTHSWEGKRFSENWMYFRHDEGGVGLFWDESCKLQCREWSNAFEHEITGLAPGNPVSTPPLSFMVGRFTNWRQFRKFVTGIDSKTTDVREVVDISVNDGNPFPSTKFDIDIREHRLRDFDGTADALAGDAKLVTLKPGPEDARRFIGNAASPASASTLELAFDFSVIGYRRKKELFPTRSGEVTTACESDEGRDIYVAENDRISMRLCPQYGHVIYSCSFEGSEWLGTMYPVSGPRDWWNPWIGGFGSRPGRLSNRVVLKEPRDARLVAVTDNFGNRWTGIESMVRFEEHEQYKGLAMYQYFLLLAGVPVVLHQVRYEQRTGRYCPSMGVSHELFAAGVGGGDSADCDVLFSDRDGARVRIRSGLEERWLSSYSPVSVRRADRGECLTLYTHPTGTSHGIETNKKSTLLGANENMSLADGAIEYFSPSYLVFGNEYHDRNALIDLMSLRVASVEGL